MLRLRSISPFALRRNPLSAVFFLILLAKGKKIFARYTYEKIQTDFGEYTKAPSETYLEPIPRLSTYIFSGYVYFLISFLDAHKIRLRKIALK